MKIALVCTSLGYSWRGFERFTSDLFNLVERDLPITLFGARLNGSSNQISLPCLKHDEFLKFLKGRPRDHYYFQQLSYAASFIPLLALKGYDLVHCSEPAMENFLFNARKMFKFRYKLLFTDGLGLDPGIDDFFRRPDHIQSLTAPHYQSVIRAGINPKKVTCLPYGIYSSPYLVQRDKKELRRKYGVPQDKTIVLSMSALNRRHKRIDYLIQEISQLGKEFFLLVVGHPEERDLIQLGQTLMGDRFKSIYVPFKEMPEVYAMGDIFVMSSLIEGFCLALAEAMCSGLPVLAHRSPHFQWLIGDSRCLVDLEGKGNLAEKIKEVSLRQEFFQSIAEENRKRCIERFDWQNLKPHYLEMYQKIAEGN